jgi:hypothetical protein
MDGSSVRAELMARSGGGTGVRGLLGRRAAAKPARRPAPVYKMAKQMAAASAAAGEGGASDGGEGEGADSDRPDGDASAQGSADDDDAQEAGLARRQGPPLPYESEALKTLLYNAAWRKAEDGSGATAPAGEATARELVRTVELPLRKGREGTSKKLCEQLSNARTSALDRLEVEFNAQSKILERKGAPPETLLGRITAACAKLLTELHDEAVAGSDAQLAQLAKEHTELLSIMRGKTDRMVGELIQESKEGLHNRHGWKSAEVAKKLTGAQMAARSAAEADWRHKLEASMNRERALMDKVASLTEANLMLTQCVTARNADEDCERSACCSLLAARCTLHAARITRITHGELATRLQCSLLALGPVSIHMCIHSWMMTIAVCVTCSGSQLSVVQSPAGRLRCAGRYACKPRGAAGGGATATAGGGEIRKAQR